MLTFAGQRIDAGKRIVLAHGTFDILHPGHIAYLQFAKSQGDILIVALAADKRVRETKGLGRPVQAFAERKAVLGAMQYVDGVIEAEYPNEDLIDNLFHIVKKGRPDVFVTSHPDFKVRYGELLQRMRVELVISARHGEASTASIINKILTSRTREENSK